MKKIVAVILALTLVLGVAVGLIACKKKNTSNENLKKVAQAFNGVESTLNKKSSLTTSVAAEKSLYLSGAQSASVEVEKALSLAAGTSATDALTAIWGVYTSGDKQASASAEMKYDEPPMMQFRYLKAIFEEMGDDFVLGTKYYYDITGQMYIDMATGYAVSASDPNAASYRYDYVFGFAISVDLKEDDTIFAEVAFDITLTKGSEKYETSWYVSFDLDYDFDNSDPTYTLTMLTDNKEAELTFLNRPQGYEYDYVEVKKGSIVEWRKFVMDVSREITLGGNYASFADHIAEGVTYRADTAKWLKDGEYYKVTQLTDDKNRTLATAFVDGMGMNSTVIGGAAFLSKQGTKSTVIDTYYKKICEVFGGDIIYDLVTKDPEDDKNGADNGSGNEGGSGSSSSGSNWASVVPAALTAILPAFDTSSATFSVESVGEGILMIRVTDAGRDDYSRFGETLERAGFSSLGGGNYGKTVDGTQILVTVSAERNAIVISTKQNETKKSIEIANGIAYDDISSVGNVQTQAVNDYSQIASGIERDFADTLNVKAMSGICVGSMYYDITLAYASATEELTAERYAAGKANAYAGKYVGGSWTNRYNNTVNWSYQNGKDILILISSAGSGIDAHVYVYSLMYEEGTASIIVDGGSGGGGSVGEDGGNGNGTGNEGGGNGNGTGNEGGGNGGGNGGVRTVIVNVNYLDADKKVLRNEIKNYPEGYEIDLNTILSEPGQNVYSDPACETPVERELKATEGLTIYVWANSKEPDESQLYDITVYDVVNGVVSEKPSTVKQTALGETTYYGSSFAYVVYWDEECTDMVPLDYNFTMTEDGITLYRDMTEDYVVVKTDYYLNATLCEHREGFYRKGLIYHVINNVVIDTELYSTYSEESRFFIGGRAGTPIGNGDIVAFIADETLISGYGENPKYKVYTVMAGDTALGQVVTDQPQYVDHFGATYGENSAVNADRGIITLKNTTTYQRYVHYSVWKGRKIVAEETYFNESFEISEEGARPEAASTYYFTDERCTSPITFNEKGVFVVTSSKTLYSPMKA